MRILGALVLTIYSVGCASFVDQSLNPNTFYKRDIELRVNNKETFIGVGVPARSKEYHIRVKAPGRIDLITIRSCHREMTIEPDSKVFGKNNYYTFDYKPISGLEDGQCPLDIGCYEELKGRHSWALLDFESDQEQVSAELKCNGEKYQSRNVSICQAREGTIQKIQFEQRLKVSPDPGKCNVMTTKDERGYRYIMPKGECTYFFCGRAGYCHRLTTIGYESILVRKVGE